MDTPFVTHARLTIEQLWAVENCHPRRDDPEILKQAEQVACKLRSLVSQAEANACATRRELAEVWRLLGDAQASASAHTDAAKMLEANESYRKAASYSEVDDGGLEFAKLCFNHANLVRSFDQGANLDRLIEARNLYNKAYPIIAAQAPDLLSQLSFALQSVEAVIQAARLHNGAAQKVEELQHMLNSIETAKDNEQILEEVSEAFRAHEASGTLADILKSMEQIVDLMSSINVVEDNSSRDFKEDIEAIRSSLPTGAMQADPMMEFFPLLETEIEKRLHDGEVDAVRAETLRQFLNRFRSILQRPADTPEQMAQKLTDMRGITASYKSLMDNIG